MESEGDRNRMSGNGQGIEPAVLDDIINRLLEFRNARTVRQVQLSENEIRVLCSTSREIFLSQPNLLELEAPIKICGIPFFSFSYFVLFPGAPVVVMCVCMYSWLAQVFVFLVTCNNWRFMLSIFSWKVEKISYFFN